MADISLFGYLSGTLKKPSGASADALVLEDDAKLTLGEGKDLALYHDGTNSYITNTTGELKIATETSGVAITIGHSTSEVTIADNLTVTGDLTVQGDTTTLTTTNTVVSDKLFELGNGTTGSPTGDAGIIIERGDSDNAIIAWDESVDKFVVGIIIATGSSSGDLTITTATLLANIEGNITGDLTGNADTASAWASSRTVTFATGDVTGSFGIDGSADVSNVALTIGAGTVEGTMLNANTVDDTTIALSSNQLIVKDGGVSLAKLATLSNLKVIGNLSGLAATPSAVDVIDDDTMATASDTSLATSESIKAYVDSQFSSGVGDTITIDNTKSNSTSIAAGTIMALDIDGSNVTVATEAGNQRNILGVLTTAITGLTPATTSGTDSIVHVALGKTVYVKFNSNDTISAADVGSDVYLSQTSTTNGQAAVAQKSAPDAGVSMLLGVLLSATASSGLYQILWRPQYLADLG
jgi:hypothetical protein